MIAFDNHDEVYVIYCHHDGYIDGVGRILLEHWNDIEDVEALMDLGDLSILGSCIGEKQDFNNPNKNWCLAYGRDLYLSNSNSSARVYGDLSTAIDDFNDSDAEFMYVFDGHTWSFKQNGPYNLGSLSDYLKNFA
jgi:hypothetical protein